MNNSIEFKSFLQVTELGTILATEIFKSVGSSLMAGKKVKVKSLSRVQLFATPWTVVYQAPPSMGFSRQEYWSGLPFPSPGGLPNPGIEPRSPALQEDALPSEPPGKPMARKMSFYQNITRDSSKYSFPKASAGRVVCVCWA